MSGIRNISTGRNINRNNSCVTAKFHYHFFFLLMFNDLCSVNASYHGTVVICCNETSRNKEKKTSLSVDKGKYERKEMSAQGATKGGTADWASANECVHSSYVCFGQISRHIKNKLIHCTLNEHRATTTNKNYTQKTIHSFANYAVQSI